MIGHSFGDDSEDLTSYFLLSAVIFILQKSWREVIQI
jgi:hypothetical protein